MIDHSIVRAATRIRRRYAEALQARPYHRVSPAMAAIGVRGPTAAAYPLIDALREARTIARGRDLGLTCTIEADDLPWDADAECPAPRHVLCAIVRDESGSILASLGGIGVDTLDDPYLETCEADLFAEAIAEIDAERDRKSTADAIALASRATFAGVSPEVHS